MAEIGIRDSTATRSRGGSRGPGRDFSPDSVIYTLDSNFSLFSSASASVDRCSFASDAHDRDSISSDFSQHVAGQETARGGRECLSSQDLDLPHLNKVTVLTTVNGYLGKKAEKAEVEKHQDNNVPLDVDGDAPHLDSARNSFSLALKECQERRSRSEANANKVERWRPAPLDLNNSAGNVVNSSPRLVAMNKNTVLSRKSSNLPSPGTPNYHHASGGMNKGWSSERVALQTSTNRRQGGTVLPFNNGKTLPSKWEDAERWILSPVSVSGDGMKPLYQQPQRRQKSKSGPLGAPGIAYYSMYSPGNGFSVYDQSNVNSTISASPFSFGLMTNAAASVRFGNNANFHNTGEPGIARSFSVHGCSDLVCQSSLDEKVGYANDGANVCRTVSRRDIATQMSPVGSANSSSRKSSFSVSTPSISPAVEVQSFNSSKPEEVRDVQVDERVTVTRWSKKHKSRISGKGSLRMDDWQLKAVEEAPSSSWQNLEASKSLSNCQSEEAKIAAWENLQKAKAEAAIRKLEMKLEKKRSTSMEKIMKKLKSAQKKAQEMRTNQANHSPKTSFKVVSSRRTRQMSSLSGCFTCHAF